MKKNLIILLLIPFLIALLGVVTLNTTFKYIDNDILSIEWDYDDIEAFKISDGLYPLEAKGVNEKNYPAGAGNQLTWTVTNADINDETVYAEIIQQGANYFLKTYLEGNVVITCSNEKGNVFRSMNAIIYKNGAIIVQTDVRSSQNNVDPVIYYGEYDLDGNKKKNAVINLDIKVIPSSYQENLKVESISDNIEFNLEKQQINVLSKGDASLVLSIGDDAVAKPFEFKFNVVENGINVYSYNDLLACTNKSTNGEIVVLRKSFESLDNAFVYNDQGNLVLDGAGKPVLKSNNVECFGNYDVKSKSFNFANEIYSFKTTFNYEYIRQWNEYMARVGSKNTISTAVKAGLRVQKDFYGNGYTINMHNLTFPSSVIETTDKEGNIIKVPYLANSDLFRGPLPFYALGDHNNMPLVEAYGQDNVGMYLNNNNITLNDLNIKNCDFGNMLSNLDTTGTVVEVDGDNITIKNSRMSNGKTVLRSFSSNNLLIDNSMLSNARNFLITTGSNEYVSINENLTYDFIELDGSVTKSKVNDYIAPDKGGDALLNKYILANFDSKDAMKKSLLSMQKAFNNEEVIKDNYKGSMTINDTLFYRSGIASIALESMFNGPFLNSAIPSEVTMILGGLSTQDGRPLDGFKATNVAGVSYPVTVDITGNTKFYDYKDVNDVDIEGLIKENISAFAASIDPDLASKVDINIDKIFPIKQYLTQAASSNGDLYAKDGKTYINIPVAYYGGGLNLSKVTYSKEVMDGNVDKKLTIDLLDSYLSLEKGSGMTMFKNMMLKSVTIVTGYEPFYFECIKGNGYLYGETPNVSDLIQNAKGGKSDNEI